MGGKLGSLRALGVVLVLLSSFAPAVGATPLPALVVIRGIGSATRYIPGSTCFNTEHPNTSQCDVVADGWADLVLSISQGQSLDVVNADLFMNTHSLTSDDCWVDGTIQPCVGESVTYTDPIFDSHETKFNSGVVHVAGVETVPAGTYTFYCTIHGHAMTGALTVS